jgi:phage terminase large subunit-like protein
LYTDIDLRKKDDPDMNIAVEGSIVLICGHSNPDSLRGYSAICILFDELQYYTEHPVVSGRDFYNALIPSMAKFDTYGGGKLVELSTTGIPSGIFHSIHKQGQSIDKQFDRILGFHLATWDINDEFPYDGDYLTMLRSKDPEAFNIEFGAMWSTMGSVHKYFPEDKVMGAVDPNLSMEDQRDRGCEYFMHIDPASKHDTYACAVVKRVRYVTSSGEKRFKIVLAFHAVWKPQPGVGLDIVKLDDEILEIARIFKPISVTYDTWNSVHSISYLSNKGFYAKQLPFGRGPKANYYKNLFDLMDRRELVLYGSDLVVGEMLNIKYRPTQRGVQIFPDPQADITTDDLLDCVAGAAWMAIGRVLKNPLPQGVVANIHFT